MGLKTHFKVRLFLSLILIGMIYNNSCEAQIKIGVFADCQYCDCETAGTRYYRNSPLKLSDCIAEFNQNKNIEFVVGLGDFIDKNFASYSKVNSILEKSENEVFHVIGNHDFSVKPEFLNKVPEQLNLTETYYTFAKKGWQFIFLNGNEITLQSNHPEIIKQAKNKIEQLTFDKQPNNQNWNGGMSEVQILWLEQQLKVAQQKSQKVAIFCHYPLLPLEAHTLWNSKEVLAVLKNYSCVKLWMNGHNHAGNDASLNGIHFVTLKGMVETESETAFSIVSFSENEIEIEGFGREIDRKLPIK